MELHQTPDPQPVKQPPAGDPPQPPKNDRPEPAQPGKFYSAFHCASSMPARSA
ncbi:MULTISPECIES: hypothetical protein [Burkholderia]|uniref:Uncharacterized protein n=1 Tax=Burkholderia singularis TaxID=1503053 RepID=A0A238H332_9BURK|nr:MULTISPECIES: hypothetical protein [Burkholderia]SMF99647.1 hypothetical protein BSIN_2830 [Burkholderia singularis]